MLIDDLITSIAAIAALDIMSCDVCSDGCVDHDSSLRPECLKRLVANRATAAALCRSWQLGRIVGWTPGSGQATT